MGWNDQPSEYVAPSKPMPAGVYLAVGVLLFMGGVFKVAHLVGYEESDGMVIEVDSMSHGTQGLVSFHNGDNVACTATVVLSKWGQSKWGRGDYISVVYPKGQPESATEGSLELSGLEAIGLGLLGLALAVHGFLRVRREWKSNSTESTMPSLEISTPGLEPTKISRLPVRPPRRRQSATFSS
jgi:hypothetical protein